MRINEEWKEVKIYNQDNGSESVELYNIAQELEIEDVFSLIFDGDPDRVRIDDKIYLFETFNSGNTLYIAYIDTEYIDGHRERIERLLKLFFEKDYLQYFALRESNWDFFLNDCVAYRGGAGKIYSIWNYKGI